ncbi:MAG: hypothetical protein K8T91_12935 [Planctomycetes bacterium]|nr:hypothetical protein [Planctomycetota bacterium]
MHIGIVLRIKIEELAEDLQREALELIDLARGDCPAVDVAALTKAVKRRSDRLRLLAEQLKRREKMQLRLFTGEAS